ncbi:hypothetical protein KAR91_83515 [Candidatus Pacearchaeota archaeon]|nr:hypothetical protein [Candidatus Pacearchaeota archaeon]
MTIAFSMHQQHEFTIKQIKYTLASEKQEAIELFKEKTGKAFEDQAPPFPDENNIMVHLGIRKGGCNPRSEEGCFQCETNGSFYLKEKGTWPLDTEDHYFGVNLKR